MVAAQAVRIVRVVQVGRHRLPVPIDAVEAALRPGPERAWLTWGFIENEDVGLCQRFHGTGESPSFGIQVKEALP